MRIETIYGEDFEVIKPRKCEVVPVYPSYYSYNDIYDAYDRPSDCKVEIWEHWLRFGLEDDERYHIGRPFICSHNVFTFTVTMNVYDNDNDGEFVGVMVITRDHNRLYLA